MLMLADVISDLSHSGELIPLVAIVGGITMIVILGVVSCIGRVVVTRAREQTRRDLAAFIAEGTVDPAHAVALMSAGKDKLQDVKTLCADLAQMAAAVEKGNGAKESGKPNPSRRGVRVGIFAGSNCC